MKVSKQHIIENLLFNPANTLQGTYCMVGNFRGMLIFVIFVVDLAGKIISIHKN